MKKTFAAFASALALFTIDLHAPSAEACGVKLIVKNPNPRQVAARSARPSDVLIVGSNSRLSRQLAAKGHNVEVASDPASAKRPSYAVVVADREHESSARARFGDVVLVRSDDVAVDVRTVESQVARRPMRAASDRAVVAARGDRKPIAVGPGDSDRRVAAGRTGEPTPTPPATPAPAEVRATERPAEVTEPAKPEQTATVKPEKPEKPEKPVATVTPSRQELYFGLGASSVTNRAQIAKAVKWLKANPTVDATIEGHADPTGTREGNQLLSERRAEAVRDLLVEAGIDSSRLEVVGFGDTRLKYGQTDGRNRRVAIEPKQ